MTIEKGSPWGAPTSLPDDAVVVASDAEARRVVEKARHDRRPIPPIGLTGGDLFRTLGGRGSLETAFPVDLGEVLIDGRLHLFVAHLVARTPGWGDITVAMNAQWLGRWNVGHKAHPNDGVLDVYQARLGPTDRLKVRARLPHGTFMPHPGITQRRVAATQVRFDRPRWVRLDGERVLRARNLSIRVEPDALKIIV